MQAVVARHLWSCAGLVISSPGTVVGFGAANSPQNPALSLSPLLTLGGALAMRICPAWSSTLEEFRESLDDGHNDFADDAQVEQDQHQNNAVGFQSGEPVCRAGGQDSHQNAGAVQGRDRQQIEDCEHHVDPDAAFQEEQQNGQRIARLSGVQGRQQAQEDGAGNGQGHVGGRAGQRYGQHVFLRIPEVARIDRHRFGPADIEKDKGQNAQNIQVFQWIHGQAAGLFGGGIAQLQGHIAVGQLVQAQGQEQWRGGNEQSQQKFRVKVHNGS